MKNFARLTALAFLAATAGFGGVAAPTAQAGAVLTGNFTGDNYAFAYLSTSATTLGTLIGSSSAWPSPAAINVTNLLAGTTYYLNFEVINGDPGTQYNSGGFLGSFSLSGATFANGTASLLSGTAGWLGIYNDSNYSDTAQSWIAPTVAALSLGVNGVGPWGNIGSISSSANWIWASDSQSENPNSSAPGAQCAACTIDLQASFTTAVPDPPAGRSCWPVSPHWPAHLCCAKEQIPLFESPPGARSALILRKMTARERCYEPSSCHCQPPPSAL